MKFFYINNSLCGGCDDCSVACPSGAVYASGGKRYIIHDKCTSCGACIRTCGHNAVSIEGIDGMVERMENADLYLSRIRRLEQELSQVNTRLEQAKENFRSLISRYPSAAAVCDSKGRIIIRNCHFERLSGDSDGRIENITGVLPPEAASALLRGGAAGVEVEFPGNHNGKRYIIHGIGLPDGNMLCLFDYLADSSISAARITEALDKAILRQMETVRKIGTILGDETSLTLNDINRALELLEASADEKQ